MTTTTSWPALPSHAAVASDRVLQRSWWRIAAWVIIAAVGAIHGWAGRQEMTPDGIAYLDLADAFLRGDWGLAFNRLWSPLYPALIAAVRWIVKPEAALEFPVVHLTNLAIFLGALAGFEFLLSEVIAYRRARAAGAAAAGRRVLPDWLLRLLGYALFACSSLPLTPVPLVSPDLLVSVFVYLALALVLKLGREPEGTAPALLLGVVLGLGYLAKAAMLPLALVFLALAAAHADRRRHGLMRRMAAATVPFAAISGSLVLAFALTGQGATLGESGKLNYAYHINGLPYVHWQGDSPQSGRPVHPTRMILSSPAVYEFAGPIRGTYAPWDDPAYWYEGLRVRFDARGHLENLVRSARVMLGVLLRTGQIGLVIGAPWLLSLRRRRSPLRDLLPYGMLLAPLFAAVGLYALVWLERRFVAPFLAPFWLGIFAAMTFGSARGTARVVTRVTVAMVVMLVLVTSSSSYAMARALAMRHALNQQPAAAEGLERFGIGAGAPVAVINDWPGGSDAYWARLARVRIIAELPACRAYAGSHCPAAGRGGVEAFVRTDPTTRARILRAFAVAGAAAVVMRDVDHAALPGWSRIGGTDYYVYPLQDGLPPMGPGAGS